MLSQITLSAKQSYAPTPMDMVVGYCHTSDN